MTIRDRQRFQRAYNALAIATRLPADQADADALRVYWSGLEGFPVEVVEAAATQLSTTATWFPKLVEWRAAAVDAQRQLVLASNIPATRGWQSECAACDDTGWDVLDCPGATDSAPGACARTKPHGGHSYVVACPCRATNSTYRRRRVEQLGRAVAAEQ